MLKCYTLADGRLVESSSDNASVLVYSSPDEAERGFLTGTLLVDEHNLVSSLDPDELGRVEFETNHIAVIVKRPRRYRSQDAFLLKVLSIGLFLFNDKLIIISQDDFTFEGRTFNKARSLHDVFLKTLFMCIRHFEEHLMVIQKISDELEHEINRDMSNKNLLSLFQIEKSLVYYLNAISSNSKMGEKLKLNAVKLALSQDSLEFLDDLIIENAQCYEQANTYSQVVAGLMDARASVINNNLSIRLKMLTIFSICIMMPTLIVSLFSMNVQLPVPQEGTTAPFWFIMAAACLSIVAILTIWRVRKW